MFRLTIAMVQNRPQAISRGYWPIIYNCEMLRGKTIELKGMCRMGSIVLQDSIRVKRAGARGSAMTKLMVAEGGGWCGVIFPRCTDPGRHCKDDYSNRTSVV